jgi:hypothetical protein
MSDQKSPVDRALDVLVFAPLGLALEARRLLPGFVERGRQQATTQVTLAKMFGQLAVQQGQVEAAKLASNVQRQATTTLRELGVLPEPAPARTKPAPASAAAPTRGDRPTPSPASPPEPARSAAATKATPGSNGRSGAGAAELAIPDYDSLSASQVVPRLAGLSSEELEAVRTYEAKHRGRKTILNRVTQLQSGQ